MGHGSWTAQDWSSYSDRSIKGKTANQIYNSSSLKPEYSPKNVDRESRESADHPVTSSIIVGLDVTGSMGRILNVVADKLGTLVTEIIEREPVPGPQIMFNAIGDYPAGDSAPFQVTQFESDIRIAKQLTDLYFEGGGGGNHFESYPLAWYFAAHHTSIDCFEKHGKKGFIFTMGDDGYPSELTVSEIENVFGDKVESNVKISELINQVNRKYEVFHLCLTQGGSHSDSDLNKWRELLGERAIKVTDYTKIPEIIISILEAINGKDIDAVVDSWDGSTGIVVRQAISGITSTNNGTDLVEFD